MGFTQAQNKWIDERVAALEDEGLARESLNAMEGLPTLSAFEVGVRARIQVAHEFVEARHASKIPADKA